MHDLVVVSDLHLGRGRNPATGRYHGLENFFYDDDFLRFCRWACRQAADRGTPVRLVLNGDTFDLLRIEPEEPRPSARARERRFGPTPTPETAARTVADILEGHPAFVDALAEVLAAGHEIVMLPGNHDPEMQWTPVQDAVRRAIDARLPPGAGDALERLAFAPWFHHEPGRIWIEHGSQYDRESAFHYPLRGRLNHHGARLIDAEPDLPLGSFFQRYLYNGFGPIAFIVPSARANGRYFKWLLLHQPHVLARVVAVHVPFALQLLRRLSRVPAEARRALGRAHREELAALAVQSGLGARLLAIDALKQVRTDTGEALRTVGWQLVRLVGVAIAVALLGAGLWFAGFDTITHLQVGFGPRTLLFLGLNFALATVLAGGLAYLWFRSPPAVPPQPLRRAAQRIADLVEVPLVTFGHTHDEVVCPLPAVRRAWYFNTGTWIPVFTHDVLTPRDRVQFTFLRVRGHDAELLHWSPARAEPVPVVLLEDGEEPETPE